MANNKRYYWIKLNKDFFRQKEMKLLRKIAGGDTFTIIYLKMLLASANSNGILRYESVCDSVAEEIALDIDEDIDNVEVTLNFLQAKGLLEVNQEGDCFLPESVKMVGSEGASAERKRKYDARKKEKELQSNGIALQSNTQVTISNTEIDKDEEIDEEEDKDCLFDDPSNHPTIKKFIKKWNSNKVVNKINEPLLIEYEKELNDLSEIYQVEDIFKAISKISESNYLLSVINIDWFLKKDNFRGVLSGKYDDYYYNEIKEDFKDSLMK